MATITDILFASTVGGFLGSCIAGYMATCLFQNYQILIIKMKKSVVSEEIKSEEEEKEEKTGEEEETSEDEEEETEEEETEEEETEEEEEEEEETSEEETETESEDEEETSEEEESSSSSSDYDFGSSPSEEPTDKKKEVVIDLRKFASDEELKVIGEALSKLSKLMKVCEAGKEETVDDNTSIESDSNSEMSEDVEVNISDDGNFVTNKSSEQNDKTMSDEDIIKKMRDGRKETVENLVKIFRNEELIDDVTTVVADFFHPIYSEFTKKFEKSAEEEKVRRKKTD